MIRTMTGAFLAVLMFAACPDAAAQGETKSLRDAVKRYEKKIAELEAMIQNADQRQRTKAEERRRRDEAAQRKLAEAQRANSEKLVFDLRAKLDHTMKQLAESSRQRTAAESKSEDLANRLKQAQTKLQGTNADLTKSRQTIGEQVKQLAGARGRIETLSNRAKDATRFEALVPKLRKQLEASTARAAGLRSVTTDTKKQHAELAAHVTDLRAKLDTVESKLAAALKRGQEAEQRPDRSKEVAVLRGQLQSMQRRFDELLGHAKTALSPATTTPARTVTAPTGAGIHIHNSGGTVIVHVNGAGSTDVSRSDPRDSRPPAAQRQRLTALKHIEHEVAARAAEARKKRVDLAARRKKSEGAKKKQDPPKTKPTKRINI